MKKLFLLTLAAAVLSFAGCQKNEFEDPNNANEDGSTFELVAEIAQTKTTLDGLTVEWEEGDIIYMVTSDGTWGAPYADDKDAETIAEFTYADGKFTSDATITDGDYTFKGMYARADQKSFHRGASTSHKLRDTQAQDCANPTAHIKDNDALVGTFAATAPMAEPAKVAMNHLYTMMQVDVKNNTGNALEITKFEMTAADADLAGIFNVTAFDTPAISTKSGASSTITVNVTGGNVAAGDFLPVYFVMAPLSNYSGDVTFKVTDASENTYSKTVTLSGITFAAGEYNTTPYTISTADEVEPEPEPEGISLPWSEDFSGDMSQYTLVDGGTTTKLYEENLAGGSAPELLVSKTNGSFSATIAADGYVGMLTLTFKCNYPDRLTVTSPTTGVEVSKESNTEYIINITEASDDFELVFTNTYSGNARLDDIYLVKGAQQSQTLTFERSAISFYIGSDDAAAFTGQFVMGVQTTVTYSSSNEEVASVNPVTGEVSLGTVEGSATITAVAQATEEYKEAEASYQITLNNQSQGGDDTTSGTHYVKVTSAPTDWSGEYLLVGKNVSTLYALDQKSTGSWGTATAVTETTSGIAADATTNAYKLVVEAGTVSGTYSFKLIDGSYMSSSAAKKFNVAASKSANATDMKISLNSDGTITIESNTKSGRKLHYNYNNGSGGFRYYDNNTSLSLPYLYKLN